MLPSYIVLRSAFVSFTIALMSTVIEVVCIS